MIERRNFDDYPYYGMEEEKRWETDGFRFTVVVMERDEDGYPQRYIDGKMALFVQELPYRVWGGRLDGTPLGEFVLVDHERLLVTTYWGLGDQGDEDYINRWKKSGGIVINTEEPNQKIMLKKL